MIIQGLSAGYCTAATTSVPSLSANKKTLYIGFKTYQIEIEQVLKNGTITYQTSNSKVVKVDKLGLITPVSKGNAVVTANVKQNGKSYPLKLKVTVKDPELSFTSSTGMLNIGEQFNYRATVVGSSDIITYRVSDEKIASIDSKTGLLKATQAGTVTVTAEAGALSKSCELIIGTNRIGTYNTEIRCYKGQQQEIWITVDNYSEDESFKAKVTDDTITNYKWGVWNKDFSTKKRSLKILPEKTGETTIVIQSNTTTDFLILHVIVMDAPEDITKKELNAKDLYAKCGPATVEILATMSNGTSQGSGFFVDKGIVVTNFHVIDSAKAIEVTTYDKQKYNVTKILGYDKQIDLAILQIDTKNDSLPIHQGDISIGETIYALGSPFGLTGTLTDGIISTASRIFDGVDCIQISASISHGNSGGPLLNAYGEVIGVNTFTYTDGQNINFAVNIKELQKINTNHPLTVTEFYDICYEQFLDELYLGDIIENRAVSMDPEICQEIDPYYSVIGSIKQPNIYDYYYFYKPTDGPFIGAIGSNSFEEMKETYFVVIDMDGEIVAYGTESEEDPIQTMTIDLPKGEYYIVVYTKKDYQGTEIPYNFILWY
jgi:hypothetical protein